MACGYCQFLEAMYAELSAPLLATGCIVTAGTALSGSPLHVPSPFEILFLRVLFPPVLQEMTGDVEPSVFETRFRAW